MFYMDNTSHVSRLTSHVTSERGFTLVELLITIAVAGILGAIAVMNAPGMLDNYRVRGAARQLHSDMQMARLRAIKEGKEFALEFIGTSYCVKLKTGANWDDGCDIAAEDTLDVIIKTVNLTNDYSGVVVCATDRTEFNPNGTATTTGATVSKGSRAQRVAVSSSGTGNVRIQTAAVCP